MWALIEFAVLAAVVLLSITEFFYPLLVGKPLFNSFRKRTETSQPEPPQEKSLEEELVKAKEKVKEIKSIQNEVDKKFKSAEQLKEESDNLFNN